MVVDLTSDFGKHVDERLYSEQIIWITTVGADGVPQPSPVWFLYHDDAIFMFSQPRVPKVSNIRHNPHVALHFDSDGRGGNIVVLTGVATVLDETPGEDVFAPYLAKYAEGIKGIGMTVEQMIASFSAPIRITVEKVRGH